MQRVACVFLCALGLAGCRAKVPLGGPDLADQTGDGGGSSAACDTPSSGAVTVLQSGPHVYSLGVDDSYVYTGTASGVWRAARSGGSASPLSGTEEADAVAVDSGHVYWTGSYEMGSGSKPQSGHGLFSAPLGGGAATMLAADAWSTQIVVDDTSVYGASPPWSVPLGGGPVTTLVQGGMPVISEAIALYGSAVYVAAAPPGPAGIASVPKTGGAPTMLVSNRAHPIAIAVDASGLYWGENAYDNQAGGIFRASLDGGGVTTLSSDQDVSSLAIDADNVYWSDAHAGEIRSVPKTGGAEVTLASGLEAPTGIVVHGGNVYWTEQPFLDASSAPPQDAGAAGPTVLTVCR